MIGFVYTWAALAAVLGSVLVDRYVLRTRILNTKLFWASYGIILFFQFIVNGILTGLEVVQYDPQAILGPRLFFAPIEDIGFGFGMVTMTLAIWVRVTQNRPNASANSPAPSSSDRQR